MSNKIQSTTNYSRFKFMEGNRLVDESRVKRLIKSIQRKNLLPQFPIVCQKNSSGLYIMDGQTRYTAAERLKLPIYFIETKSLDVSDMAATNSVQKAWIPRDYVLSYAKQGNPDFMKLKDFIEETKFPVTFAAAILGDGILERGGNISKQLVTGTFKVVNQQFANRVAGAVRACQEYFSSSRDRGFVIAISRLLALPKFSITRLVQKLEHQSRRLVKCAEWTQYVEILEGIYNWKVGRSEIAALQIEVQRMMAAKDDAQE